MDADGGLLEARLHPQENGGGDNHGSWGFVSSAFVAYLFSRKSKCSTSELAREAYCPVSTDPDLIPGQGIEQNPLGWCLSRRSRGELFDKRLYSFGDQGERICASLAPREIEPS